MHQIPTTNHPLIHPHKEKHTHSSSPLHFHHSDIMQQSSHQLEPLFCYINKCDSKKGKIIYKMDLILTNLVINAVGNSVYTYVLIQFFLGNNTTVSILFVSKDRLIHKYDINCMYTNAVLTNKLFPVVLFIFFLLRLPSRNTSCICLYIINISLWGFIIEVQQLKNLSHIIKQF